MNEIFKGSASSTINDAFEQLLTKHLTIDQGIRSKASDSQKHLRDFLASEHDNDQSFPRVLSVQDSDFLGGSFARHTKIWPLDDIDVYFPLDGNSLVYRQNLAPLPYTVVTDGVLSGNPLLTDRWMSGGCVSSRKLVSQIGEVLKRHYSRTDVRSDGQAVTIRMTHGETENEDGLGFDVVPCFFLRPHNSFERPFYLMPDGCDGWIRTNPRIDGEVSDKLQADNRGVYRKGVKLVKFWNKEKLGNAVKSYYIELAIARAFLDANKGNLYASKISEAVTFSLYALDNALKAGNLSSFVPNAPLVGSGNISYEQRALVSQAYGNARLAWEAELTGNFDGAISLWRQVFGDNFSG